MILLWMLMLFPSGASCTPSSGVDPLAGVETTAVKAIAAPPIGIFDPCEVSILAAAAVETASGPSPV